jgi:hypothetical protein
LVKWIVPSAYWLKAYFFSEPGYHSGSPMVLRVPTKGWKHGILAESQNIFGQDSVLVTNYYYSKAL